MNRRGFLQMLVGGVAATAAVRTWPFRAFSFPSPSLSVSEYADSVTLADLNEQAAIDPLIAQFAEELGYRAGLTVDMLIRASLKPMYPDKFFGVVHPAAAKALEVL
jgi:hypothetical protein